MAAAKTTTPASTTVKVATITGAAKDDVFGMGEDDGSSSLNVLANDPGAARIWSLAQNVLSAPAGSQVAQNIAGSFSLASGASISLNTDGTIKYNASGVAGLQNYALGETFTDTFIYTVRMANGALSTAKVTVNVAGANDAPTVAGPLAAAATEDGADQSVNLLNGASDVDHGAVLSVVNVSGLEAGLSVDGATLVVDADNAAFQHLGEGDTDDIVVSYQVSDEHGATVNQSVTVTVTGVNDVATFAGTASGAVQEDGAGATSGTVSVSDVDDGEAGFAGVAAGSSLQGTYGDFTFDAATGAWGYQLRNGDANVQALGSGDLVSDILSIASLDGTTTAITVSVSGLDEPPVVVEPPPVVTEPPPVVVDPVDTFIINRGLQVQNGRFLIQDFDGNDVIKYANNLDYSGFTTTTSVAGTGENDTVLGFSYTTGQGKNASTTSFDVVLVDYDDFLVTQLTSYQAP